MQRLPFAAPAVALGVAVREPEIRPDG